MAKPDRRDLICSHGANKLHIIYDKRDKIFSGWLQCQDCGKQSATVKGNGFPVLDNFKFLS